MIKLQVIGHLGKDATVNTVNGKNVVNFNLAHSEKWTDASGVKKEKSTWVDCSLWRDSTAVAAYLKKGQQVFVEGQPEARTYLKQDGTTGCTLSLRVSNLQLLGSANGGQQGGYSTPNPAPQANLSEEHIGDDNSLPF